jgi:hypothetical protein
MGADNLLFHKDLETSDLHLPGYVQENDPGATGAGKLWIDTHLGTLAYQLKIRNATNTGWSPITFEGSQWGGITGTLSLQTDLQAALDAKSAISHTHSSLDNALDMLGHLVTNVSSPLSASDAANKGYVDSQIGRENFWNRLSGTTTLVPYYNNDSINLGSGSFIASAITGTSLNLTAASNQIVLNSGGGVAAMTLSGISSTSAKTITFPNFTGTLYISGGTDVLVADGGTGRSTSTTAYALIAAGTSETAAQQTLTSGTAGQYLISNGSTAIPSYTWGIVQTKTANYTALLTDDVILASGTSTVIILPTAVGCSGKTFTIKNINTNATVLTVDPNGAQTIDGVHPWTSAIVNESITIVSDNANWRII